MQTRPSIETSLMYPEVKSIKHSLTNHHFGRTQEIFKNMSEQLTPINKIRNSHSLSDQIYIQGTEQRQQHFNSRNSGQAEEKLKTFADEDNNLLKIGSSESSDDLNEDHRITFSKKLPSSLTGSQDQANKKKKYHIQSSTPLSRSNFELNFADSQFFSKYRHKDYQKREQQLVCAKVVPYPKLPQTKMNKVKPMISIQLGEQVSRGAQNYSNQSLYQVVKDLQSHNKYMMRQTKKTIQSFQIYIQQLLHSNAEMESKLLEYEDIIEMMENQKLELLERQKQRQMMMEKILTQQMLINKQLKSEKQNKSESPPTIRVNKIQGEIQAKKREQEIIRLQQQLSKKQESIKLLEELISEKETIIKNMANFNNQMCLEIMELKNKNKFETCSSMESLREKDKNKGEKQINGLTIKTLQNQESDIFESNDYTKKTQGQVIQMKDDQDKLQQQGSNMQSLQKRKKRKGKGQQKNNKSNVEFSEKDGLQNYLFEMKDMKSDKDYLKNGNICNSDKYQERKTITLNEGSNVGIQQKQSDTELLFLQSQLSNQDKLLDIGITQFLNMNLFQQKQGEVTIKKIDDALKVLCTKQNKEGQKQKYKQILCNMMKKLSNGNSSQVTASIGNRNCSLGNSSQQSSNFFPKEQGQKLQQKQKSLKKASSNKSMENIACRNVEILKKIKEVKKKVESHTKKNIYYSEIMSESNNENDHLNNKQISERNSPSEGLHENKMFELAGIKLQNQKQCDMLQGQNKKNSMEL